LREFRGSKRAISPVFSTVILVLIVVIGMSAVFSFFVGYVSDYQSGRGSAVMELLEIEDVFFNITDTSSVDVWLYNYGEIEVELESVFVNGLPVNFTFYSASAMELDDFDGDGAVDLLTFSHAKYNLSLWVDWDDPAAKPIHVFRIVTKRGTIVEREYFTPEV
jgi:flagellin-like protein